MFYGLNNFIKKILPKRLFYRSLIIVAAPIIILQIIITTVFFDSLWIKVNKGMTRSLVSEVKTLLDVYKNNKNNGIEAIEFDQSKRTVKDNIDIPTTEPVIQKRVTGLLPYLSLISPITGEAAN